MGRIEVKDLINEPSEIVLTISSRIEEYFTLLADGIHNILIRDFKFRIFV
jgi:hypothetical protein